MDKNRGLTRRELLRRGARVGGALWAIPVVQVLGMSSAQASDGDSPSLTSVSK